MSIKQLNYNRISKDIHHLNKEYANGTGIAWHTIYAMANEKTYTSTTNATLNTTFCKAASTGTYIYVFTSVIQGWADTVIVYAFKMPIAGWDWEVYTSSTEWYDSITSVYEDSWVMYFNFVDNWAVQSHIKFTLATDSWSSKQTNYYTSWSLASNSYEYNERTYSWDWLDLNDFFVPLVKIE